MCEGKTFALAALVVASPGCELEAGAGSLAHEGGTGLDSSTEVARQAAFRDAESGEAWDSAHDACFEGVSVGAGRFWGTLAEAKPDIQVCGRSHPDAFLRVRVPQRADLLAAAYGVGFLPRLGVLPSRCTAEDAMACAAGHQVVVLDLPAGAEVALALTSDETMDAAALAHLPAGDEATALESEEETADDSAMDGSDPWAFAVDVAFRRVLAAGAPCRPEALGRCEAGTHCEVAEDPNQAGEAASAAVFRCLPVVGESCARPRRVDVGPDTVVTLDTHSAYADDHHHTCGGIRVTEQVLRLHWQQALREHLQQLTALPDGSTRSDAELRLSTTASDVALAVREPGCLPGAEVACATGTTIGSEVIVHDIADWIERDAAPFVFVEYMADDVDGAIDLRFELRLGTGS